MEISILGYKIRVEIIILFCVLYLITVTHTICGCCNKEKVLQLTNKCVETFSNLNNANFESKSSLLNVPPVNTDNWGSPNLAIKKGEPISDGAKEILNRDPQEIPLPEGQMDILSKTKFSLDCCPNTYSNSTGCACMTKDQYDYLTMRGGNNVPYSQY